MWLDKKEQSKWAYNEAIKLKSEGKQVQDEITDLITEKYFVRYCRSIVDDKRIWSKIRLSDQAAEYCMYVKDRQEVRNKIKTSRAAWKYYKYICPREEIRKLIKTHIGKINLKEQRYELGKVVAFLTKGIINDKEYFKEICKELINETSKIT